MHLRLETPLGVSSHVQSSLVLASARTRGKNKTNKNNLLLLTLLGQFEVHQKGFLCTAHYTAP